MQPANLPIQLRDEMCRAMVGRKVTYRRLAANSLMLYIDSAPDERTGYLIWFEPTWRVVSASGLLICSDQEIGERKEDLGRYGKPLSALLGRTVEEVIVDERSRDLIVTLEGGLEIRTFVADPTAEHIWHIDDQKLRVALYASATEFEIVQREG